MELKIIAKQFEAASFYLDIFGKCEAGKEEEHVKRIYRRLARVTHPDKYRYEPEKGIAEALFATLGSFYDAANLAIANGTYGQEPSFKVKSKKAEHEVGNLLTRGDICDIFKAVSNGKKTVFKLARKPADADLLNAEKSALNRLHGENSDATLFPYLPKLVDAVSLREKSITRRANVLEQIDDDWYSLEQIKYLYPYGIHVLDMVWIWRRLLFILGHVHERHNLIHGAILPNHILIHPQKHGLILLDWCYSIEEGAGNIKAVVPSLKGLYPKEVLDKVNPTFSTDIFMAVRSMIYLLGGDAEKGLLEDKATKGIRAFFKGSSQENQKLRPQSAWGLLEEFDELLERMGSPFYPRKYRELVLPV